MNPTDFQDSINQHNKQNREDADKQAQIDTVSQSADKVVTSVKESTKATLNALKTVKGSVDVNNLDGLIKQLKENELSTLLSGQSKPTVVLADSTDFGDKMAELGSQFKTIINELRKDNTNDKLVTTLTAKFSEFVKQVAGISLSPDKETKQLFKDLKQSVDNIDTKPVVNVPQPKVVVDKTPTDFSPVTKALVSLEESFNKIKLPDPIDLTPLVEATAAVQKAITSQRFPVPNYVLPFVNPVGKAIQAKLNADGSLSIGSGFALPASDYISLAQASLTDTYTYKFGGSGGATVATVTITYTDTDKATISTVAKT